MSTPMREGSSRRIRSLQGCINDLIGLLALPAIWSGGNGAQVLDTLLEVLVRMLCLEFAYARLNGMPDSMPTEICRVANGSTAGDKTERIGQFLRQWIEGNDAPVTTALSNPIGPGEIKVTYARLGLGRERGFVVAASTDPGFPNEVELLLFKTAVNQAIIELQRNEVAAAQTQTAVAEYLKNQLLAENSYLRQQLQFEGKGDEIIGLSQALQKVLLHVGQVAPTKACVLIQGETGTGKELVARAIHRMSARREYPFVKLNCAAIPTGLLEAELFGHEKGAFTSAVGQRIGRFELAHQGTIFLDEIGEIPLELQAKLLRVLQEQEFERLGSPRTTRVDVRLVAATNRNLAKMVEEGHFRNDLFYRLNVFPITIPPLRQRSEDIPLLVEYFTRQLAGEYHRRISTIPEQTMAALCRYHWPGNVRELANFIERGVILSRGTVLELPLAELEPSRESFSGELSLIDFEREHILRALNESNWIIAGPNGAAARLGMKRTSLQYKMLKLGIVRPR
ncbi:MAG: sigma-54 interaction domain-containing protein [Gammaproteobacteria bacterium]